MTKNTNYQNFVEILPQFFETDEVLSEKFFGQIKAFVNFNECFVFLLNPENINLIFGTKVLKESSLEISKELSKNLFAEKYQNIGDLLTLLDIRNSIYITPLNIKGIIYGFILYEKDNFKNDEKNILNAFSQILSYKIKDKELSEIFKTQLETLSRAVIETKNTERIKTDFIANISHELRTPLNAIIGFSELLANPLIGILNEKQNEYVNDIRISGLNLLGMINEILDIAKIEAHSMQLFKTNFQISQVINEVSNTLYPLFEKKSINFIKKIEPEVQITADFQKIQQILYNLLSNAIKFTPEYGKISIITNADNKNLIIKITDSGIGIEKKNQKKIFEKFTQLNDNSIKKESSTGLGLTIVQEFIKMHKGKLTLKSELEKGSTFTIKLPLA